MEIDGWAEALARQCAGLREELVLLVPSLATSTSGTSGLRSSLKDQALLRCECWRRCTKQATGPCPSQLPLLAQGAARARERIAVIDDLIEQAGALAQVDYSFLFDKVRASS